MSKSPKNIQAVRGMKDILPDEVKTWQEVERTSRAIFSRFDYQEIRTPLVEERDLFVRSIGGQTDIVQKEMYELISRSGRRLALRPEATAGCVRAYLEHSIHKTESFSKFYYIGPMFRAERPQAGRLRQFYQIGVEAIGSAEAYVDAEVATLLIELLQNLGLDKQTLSLNSIGCRKDKANYQRLIKNQLIKKKSSLCPDCQRRLESNAFRILDCKNQKCQEPIRKLPAITDSLCEGCRDHFEQVKKHLESLGIKYHLDPYIVRGLDYYTGAVFEVTSAKLGAKNAVAAGGRYDNLIEDLGGRSIPACGFAIGTERLISLIHKTISLKIKPEKAVFIATIGDKARETGFWLLNQLRRAGIKTLFGYQSPSVKSQLRAADRGGAQFVIIIGEDELKEKIVTLRDMSTGEESKVSPEILIAELKGKLGVS